MININMVHEAAYFLLLHQVWDCGQHVAIWMSHVSWLSRHTGRVAMEGQRSANPHVPWLHSQPLRQTVAMSAFLCSPTRTHTPWSLDFCLSCSPGAAPDTLYIQNICWVITRTSHQTNETHLHPLHVLETAEY